MAEKVQDKKIQKAPAGKGGSNPPTGSTQKPGEKGSGSDGKKGNDGKKKW